MNSVKKVAYALTLTASVVAPVMSATAFAATAASEQQATSNLVKQLSGMQSLSANF